MIKKAKSSVIQSTKGVLGGDLVFRDTRVPVRTLIEYLEAGDRLDDFLRDYPTVTKQQVIEVLELAKRDLARG